MLQVSVKGNFGAFFGTRSHLQSSCTKLALVQQEAPLPRRAQRVRRA